MDVGIARLVVWRRMRRGCRARDSHLPTPPTQPIGRWGEGWREPDAASYIDPAPEKSRVAGVRTGWVRDAIPLDGLRGSMPRNPYPRDGLSRPHYSDSPVCHGCAADRTFPAHETALSSFRRRTPISSAFVSRMVPSTEYFPYTGIGFGVPVRCACRLHTGKRPPAGCWRPGKERFYRSNSVGRRLARWSHDSFSNRPPPNRT